MFKARPNTVTLKEPFQPRKESRATVGKTNMQSCITEPNTFLDLFFGCFILICTDVLLSLTCVVMCIKMQWSFDAS